jgi:hypothetical protein
MSQRRIRGFLIISALLVVGVIGINIYRGREPRYQGRTLTGWIDEALTARTNSNHNLWDARKWQTAKEAVGNIGTNAIPSLLKWVTAEDSKPKAAVISWINSHAFHLHLRSANERQMEAYCGIRLLGAKAKPACPLFLQWTYDPDRLVRRRGLVCLVNSKADKQTLLPVFQRLITDPDKGIRQITAYQFHYNYHEEAKTAGVYKLFPDYWGLPTIETAPNVTD